MEDNNRYLAASLRWVRLCLERLVPPENPPADEPPGAGRTGPTGPADAAGSTQPAPAQPVPVAQPPAPRHRRRWGRSAPQPVAALPPALLPPPAPEARPSIEEQIRKAAAERETAAKVDPEPALVLLARRFGLSAFERDILLLCAAMELDTGFGALCARVQGPGRDYPTFGLALSALDDPAWDALAAHRPLRYARMLEVSQPGALALTSSPLRADERIVNFLKGLNALDDRLATLLDPGGAGVAPSMSASQAAVVEGILARLERAGGEDVLPVVQLVGSDPGSKLAVAQQTASALGRSLYRIGAESLPGQSHETETLARLWQRESLLLPVALYVDADTVETPSAGEAAGLQRFLSQGIGLAFAGVRDAPLKLRGADFAVEVAKPTPEEQRTAWAAVLSLDEGGPDLARSAAMLAGQFNLNLGDIQDTASLALTEAPAGPAGSGDHAGEAPEALHDRLWARCRDLTRPRLDALAQRLDLKATWDDLVLPEEPAALLRNIAGQVRNRHVVYEDWGFARTMNRGFGISALFAGESGTGKTMAAEVIANDLRLNLYRIDLSGVVSKYIGETEKNLRKLFDAAEQGGAILLFDEADALFGKRSEVKDSHDRYANIEVNYLLQRMEAFTGLAILATNMKSALDPAFMRRLRFVVNFQFPSVQERKQIWKRALPEQAPKDELDFDRLAKLTLTGGTIHNIALNAAFMAARNGQVVTMRRLLDATRMELRKLDKPFNEAELR
jgi:hypothetical protein